jgi:hypothetical protein
MSDLSYKHYSRLSDSLERALMRDALSNGQSISTLDLAKKVARAVKTGVVAIASYMVDVTSALDEARAKDARYTRTAW